MHWFVEHISTFGDRQAIAHRKKIYTYQQLGAKIGDYYHLLRDQGVSKGEVAAIISDYSFAAIAMFLALLQNKNVVIPIVIEDVEEINERLVEAQADKVIKIDGKSVKVSFQKSSSKHRLIENIQQNQRSGLILFSSGSTGKPKVMIHDLDSLVDSYRDRKPRHLNMLIFLMFDHIGGLNTLLNTLGMGALAVLPEGRDPEEICSLIEKHKVNVLPASPTFLNLILMNGAHERYDLSSVRMITYGTEAMPEGLLKRLREAFPKVKFLQTFGTSETGIAQTISKASDSLFIKIDDPNLKYKIVDGELWLRSKTQVLGYLNAPMDSFTEDGWFMTGDLVETTEDGYIKIVGRSKEVINVGGLKVLPVEVESVLTTMPEIVDCIVYGQSNYITGQTAVADVVLRNPSLESQEMKKAIRQFALARMERYKVPTKINFVKEISFAGRFKKQRKKQNGDK